MASAAPLEHAWTGRAQWRLLETGWRHGQGFLAAWQAWRDDPQRPGLLHVACALPCPPRAEAMVAQAPGPLRALAAELAAHWWGLLPGLHRLSLEGGRVLLTLHVGPAGDALRELAFAADAIALDEAVGHDRALLKALARLSRPGTTLAAARADDTLRADLRTCGFRIDTDAPGALRATYAPGWTPKTRHASPPAPSEALVVGAGLAGAAAAASLARRGWRVTVLDAAPAPASGASGLPAGLMAPHLTPDDNLLSRLARSGIRLTQAQARARLREGTDWQGGGTLEHRLKAKAAERHGLAAEGFAADWSRPASPDQRAAAGLPPDAPAVWHPPGGWIKPAALVRAWLDDPAITWRGGARVERLERRDGLWHALDAAGRTLHAAPLAVVAAALGSAALAGDRLWLHPVRGQVSLGPREGLDALPAFPLNGNGHLLPDVPLETVPGGRAWMSGATYGRGETDTRERPADHAANLARLETLVPGTAAALAPAFARGEVSGWCGVRCASTDRRPLVGPLEDGLWVSTAMGSRGLTFAALCGELLAARLHGEPLPLAASLAGALDAGRQMRRTPLSGPA
ncbi:FAD-dependent 5-carboxymethylaminomethyl-2-thiouridine(34) oxidoreductase MnmC [Ramlibacter sp. MAHUQ-53]|uniref:FAD-dependent 5-carboxymethylaminomethyl-2-thiouridine(34) oxidoreductase MnmC n=1 Tax=unclassified Ramlibacter TaxID=2617605 RepID=UPI003643CD8F